MLWKDDIVVWNDEKGKASVTVWAGSYFGAAHDSNNIPPDSWAADPANDVAILHIVLQPGSRLTLPKAHGGSSINRSLYYVEGGGTSSMKVDGKEIGEKVILTVRADKEIELELDDDDDSGGDGVGEFLLLQGKPIDEPVAQYGPFVMNTQTEINQAFRDYQQTQFGGWPWPRDDMVFPKEKGRFAKIGGKETTPDECSSADSPNKES